MEEASSAAAAPLLRGLPDEIAIWEILARLPPKSLLRCRAVCRNWRRATSSRNFLLAHHGRQPCLPLLYSHDREPSCLDILPFDHRAGVAAADQLQSIARLGDYFLDLEACCDGLLLVSDPFNRFFVCNPATRKYALLDQISGFIVVAMYPHHNTGEYRLLLRPEPVGKDACHVYALGSIQQPRNIDTGYPDGVRNAPVPVLFRRNLHWHLELGKSGSNQIIVFDTKAESFRQMRSPVHGGTSLLFEMDGVLGMYSFNEAATIIDIWVLRDYEGEIWAFRCRVELPVEEIRVQFQKFDSKWDVMVTSSDDDVPVVLVQFREWLLQIDINGMLVASFEHERLALTSLRLKQTLVSHSFLPTVKGDVVNDSPFM